MKIVTAGDNCIDYYLNLKKGFPGGNPVNVAVYCKRYIEDVSYIGVVGDDQNGLIMINSLKQRGVDVSLSSIIPKGKTAITEVDLVDGERVFKSYDMGVHKDFTLNESQLTRCYNADAFVTGIWGKCENYIQRIHNAGVITVFDFATKLDNPIFPNIAKHIDYSFFSWEGEKEIDKIKEFMVNSKKLGTKCVVVTLGSHGSIAYDGIKFYEMGIIPCTVIDTMGAGDSFIAGFTCGILKGYSIEESMRQGAESSTQTIQYRGAW